MLVDFTQLIERYVFQFILPEILRELAFSKYNIGALRRAYVGEAITNIDSDRGLADPGDEVPLLAMGAFMAPGIQEREFRD